MAAATPRVTVVGSFAVGITLRASRFPVAGETLPGSDFDMGPGGKGSNQAIGVARLGVPSSLLVKIGEDQLGQMAAPLYAAEGVDAHLITTAERNTGVGLIVLNQAGENFIVLDMGANELLSPGDVEAAEDLIAASRVVMTVLEIPVPTAQAAMRLARKHGAISVFNPAPAQSLPDELLAEVDVITPNQSELRLLNGLAPDAEIDRVAAARALQARGARNVVLTRGAHGATLVAEDSGVHEVPGYTVDVVDTTGAGDAFNAALGAALAEGRPLLAAVEFAVAAGALACTKLGVVPALARRPEIEALAGKAS
ncbi:MAG: ribokinase [Anaerolineales bacterium]|nr:ribokinase [Anaerolineales bacterium]